MIGALAKLPSIRKVRLALGLLGALLLAYLLFAGKPWSVPRPWEDLKISQYATVFLWFAAAINLVLAALLAATAPWWVRPIPEPQIDARDSKLENPESKTGNPRWFWPLVAAAMALTAFLGWPRLGHSLWHDEAYPVKRAIVGNYRTQEDGSLKLKNVS